MFEYESSLLNLIKYEKFKCKAIKYVSKWENKFTWKNIKIFKESHLLKLFYLLLPVPKSVFCLSILLFLKCMYHIKYFPQRKGDNKRLKNKKQSPR